MRSISSRKKFGAIPSAVKPATPHLILKRKLKYVREYCRILGISGLKLAANAFLYNVPSEVLLKPRAFQYPITLRSRTTDILVYEKIFIREEYRWSRIFRPDSIIVDAGANIGLSSIFFARQYPGGRVIAIEPEASNYRLLLENCAAYSSIIPIPAALWGMDTTLEMAPQDTPAHWSFQFQTARGTAAAPQIPVRGVTLNSIMKEYHIDRVDLLKLDVEGAEVEILAGPPDWIKQVDAIWIELHERLKPGCLAALSAIRPYFDDEQRIGENILLSRKS